MAINPFEGFGYTKPQDIALAENKLFQDAVQSGDRHAMRAAVMQQAATTLAGGSTAYKKAKKTEDVLQSAFEGAKKDPTDDLASQVSYLREAQRLAIEAGLPDIAIQATEQLSQLHTEMEERNRLRTEDARDAQRYEWEVAAQEEEHRDKIADKRREFHATGANAYREAMENGSGPIIAAQNARKAQAAALALDTKEGTMEAGFRRADELGFSMDAETFDFDTALSLSADTTPEYKGLTTVMNEAGQPVLAYVQQTPTGPEIVPTEHIDPSALAAIAKGSGGTDKVTDAQRRAATFAIQIEQAQDVFAQLDAAEIYFTGFHDRIEENFLNGMKPDERQKFEQARANFVQNYLRDVSGATIKGEEIKLDTTRFIPEPGDSRAVVQQKAANRRAYHAGLLAQAGDSAFSEAQRHLGILEQEADYAARLQRTGF